MCGSLLLWTSILKPELVEEVIKRGGGIEQNFDKSNPQVSDIHVAVAHGEPKDISFVLSQIISEDHKATLNLPSHENSCSTPLFYAIADYIPDFPYAEEMENKGRVEMLSCLLKHGANANARDDEGLSVLSYLASYIIKGDLIPHKVEQAKNCVTALLASKQHIEILNNDEADVVLTALKDNPLCVPQSFVFKEDVDVNLKENIDHIVSCNQECVNEVKQGMGAVIFPEPKPMHIAGILDIMLKYLGSDIIPCEDNIASPTALCDDQPDCGGALPRYYDNPNALD